MVVLKIEETDEVGGGLAWTTPALIALADSGSLGPLALSFSFGYGVGTLMYNYYLDY